MKSLVLTFLTLLAFNSEAAILCHTPRMNKIFEVSDKKVTFFDEYSKSNARTLASVVSKSQSADSGMTKVVNFENQKHIIHIGDAQNFSDVNDYIIIKSKTGHEVTYPLTCEKR